MSLRSDIERTVKLKEFHRSVEQLLTPEDKDYLYYALKEYHTYKSIAKLMLALNSCLDTPEKLDLLPYIRELIPKHDQKKFDSLAPYYRMAHPIKGTPNKVGSPQPSIPQDAVRIVNLQRPKGTILGFSIRGGREHNLGIYISHVDSFSLAERSGLLMGDQILDVNGISFQSIIHSSAVLVLRSHDDLKVVVKSVGRVPGQKLSRNSYIWVDTSGKPLKEVGGEEAIETAEDRAGGDRLLASPDRHKVVLHADKTRSLGFSIRGGREYSLGIYISVIDKGSPAEEGGLRLGDQILDVNGHNFVDVFHQEAVAILQAYQTLIMTIKSLGRLPKLVREVQEERGQQRQTTSQQRSNPPVTSPTGKWKGSGLLKSLVSPRSPTRKSPPKQHQSDLAIYNPPRSSRDQAMASQATVRASGSSNPSMRSQSGRPTSQSYHSLDFVGHSRADSSGPSTLPRAKKQQARGVSPLTTNESRAMSPPLRTSPTRPTPTSAPTTGYRAPSSISSRAPQSRHTSPPRFFEHGVGTQIMLASTTSRAEEMLIDRARRLLSKAELDTFQGKLKQYQQNRNIQGLVEFLLTLFNTPEKLQLLIEVRSVLHPSDLAMFDELVSPCEVVALHQRAYQQEEEPDEEVANHYNTVLSAIQNHGGQKVLRTHRTGDEKSKPKSPDLGVFGNSAAQTMLHKATGHAPDMTSMQTRESFLAWRDDYGNEKWQRGASFQHPPPSTNAVILELPKTAPFIGLTIEGGIDTPTPEITIKDIREGGAAQKDGFLKPGFEIVVVDGVRIRGKTHDDAARILAQAFNSENPTIELIVLPS